MSRARLGLYIFARVSLFPNCYELRPAFNQLMARPMELLLAPWEKYPSNRSYTTAPEGKPVMMVEMAQMAQYVYDMYTDLVKDMERTAVIQQKARLINQSPKEEKKEEVEDVVPMETKEELIINEIEEGSSGVSKPVVKLDALSAKKSDILQDVISKIQSGSKGGDGDIADVSATKDGEDSSEKVVATNAPDENMEAD